MPTRSHQVLLTLSSWEAETENFPLLMHLLSYKISWERTELQAQDVRVNQCTREGFPSLKPENTRDAQIERLSPPSTTWLAQRPFHRGVLEYDILRHVQLPGCRYNPSVLHTRGLNLSENSEDSFEHVQGNSVRTLAYLFVLQCYHYPCYGEPQELQ